MHKLLSHIVKNHSPVYFISPHLDDAALSAGSLISYLASKTSVSVVNVFTTAHPNKTTLSAAQFLRQNHASSATRLFSARVKEDAQVMTSLGVKVINLNFPDCLWRIRPNLTTLELSIAKFFPEIIHTYPTYRFHALTGHISHHDSAVLLAISNQLLSIVKKPNAYVFCPAGVGNHVDHLLVKEICQNLFKQLVIWIDFPYSQRLGVQTQTPGSFTYPVNSKGKKHLLQGYASQFTALFPEGISQLPPEVFIWK